jgi:hypothetical protein
MHIMLLVAISYYCCSILQIKTAFGFLIFFAFNFSFLLHLIENGAFVGIFKARMDMEVKIAHKNK